MGNTVIIPESEMRRLIPLLCLSVKYENTAKRLEEWCIVLKKKKGIARTTCVFTESYGMCQTNSCLGAITSWSDVKPPEGVAVFFSF